MAVSLEHSSLGATLHGVHDHGIAHFRGIPYAKIPKRFAEPERISDLGKVVDCTQFGPRCPQPEVDKRHLLRIPKSINLPEELEDEFACTNLDVSVPHDLIKSSQKKGIPVLVWIHGGSQAVTFGSAKSRIADPTALVQDSIQLKKPIIVVNVQYRLNVFALSNGTGPVNLALRDQRLALDWIQDHIAGFGGDANLVTVYGESAGAVYAHAHLVAKAPARQFILSSGSLYLSPPQPAQNVLKLRSAVTQKLEVLDSSLSLENASASQIVDAITASGINSWFLQQEEGLSGWQTATGDAERLMLTDVQKEAIIWQSGMWSAQTSDIVTAFELAGDGLSDELKELYHIYPDRPTSSKTGALDFLNDYKFVMPVELLQDLWKKAGKPVFRGLVDESNPWQPSTGAHHAVDILLLFSGFDISFAPAAQKTGENLRKAWIQFVTLGEPWEQGSGSDSVYGFGPHGVGQLLDREQVLSRRRLSEVSKLRQIDTSALDKVLVALAAGKISLLN